MAHPERQTFKLHPLPAARALFSPVRIDRELVAEFFMRFARAEFALKRAKFVRPGKFGEPKIKWDDFATVCGSRLFDSTDPSITAAIAYLVEHPPKQEIVAFPYWRSRPIDNPKDPVFLIKSICTVRNNLFHGGKEIEGLLAERDRQLILSALQVLCFAVSLQEEVSEAFGELPPEHFDV